MILWLPLRQKAGLGTILNMILIALSLGIFVAYMPIPANDSYWTRLLLCIGGIITLGIASAFYLTCHLGAGPRDGLMVGLCMHTGWRVGIVRSSIEVIVCVIGWLLGGIVGIGTLLFALGVGWVVQIILTLLLQLFDSKK